MTTIATCVWWSTPQLIRASWDCVPISGRLRDSRKNFRVTWCPLDENHQGHQVSRRNKPASKFPAYIPAILIADRDDSAGVHNAFVGRDHCAWAHPPTVPEP